MSNQQLNGAVQLIAFDNNKNPYITEKALSLLSRLKTNNLHVISVAGKYRTGKSYILNRVLLNRNNGFNVGHTINACTKGLWMWPELIKLNGKDCLIIDTQGLGSLEQGESTDLKIFLLALLFSSHLIYNSCGSIDEQAIESLSLVIQLANVLQRQDKYDTQELVNTFPSFLWLLRDFSLKLEDQKGTKISPTQYLQNALKHQPRSTQAAQRKNQIRKQLRTFFQERDCFALVRPTQEEKDLQNLSSLSQSKLRPEFVQLVGMLRTRLQQVVKPKRVRGRVLSTQGFVELCQYYTKALVDGKLPTISSHWDNLCLSQTHRIFQKFQLEHLKLLESQLHDVSKMSCIHKQILKAGAEAIQKSFLGKLQKQLFKQRFQRKLQSQFQEIKFRMNSKRGLQLKLLLQNLQMDTEISVSLTQRYQNVIMKMSQISQNANKDENVYCQFYLYICEFARSLLQESEGLRYNQQKLSSEKIALLEDQLATAKKQIEQKRSQQETDFQQLRIILGQSKCINLSQVKEQEQKYINEILELRSANWTIRQELKNLQYAFDKHNDTIQSLKSKLSLNDEKTKRLEQQLLQKEKDILQKQQILSHQAIKLRKMTREKEIVKHRYEEYLDENLIMRNTIDELQNKVSQLERRKGQDYQGQGLTNSQVQQLRRNLRISENQRKNITKLLSDQRSAYQTMIQTPQNISFSALKKNLEIERQERQKLQVKLSQIITIINCSQAIICRNCRQKIPMRCAKIHLQYCCKNQQNIEFDVSYDFNTSNSLLFQINISIDSRKWQIHRDILAFVKLFQALNLESTILEDDYTENHVNQNEKRRIFIEESLQKLKPILWENIYLQQFLEIANPIKIQEERQLKQKIINSTIFNCKSAKH